MLNEQALQISAGCRALRGIVHLYLVHIFVARDGTLVKRVRLAARGSFGSYQEEDRDKSSNTNGLSTKRSATNSTSVKTFEWNFRAPLQQDP
jgi:hypothetical protein